MNKKILIVEDQFIEANNLQHILERAGYEVCSIAFSVAEALEIIDAESPDLVLLDIFLQGDLTGIDLARILKTREIGFIYLSANSNEDILNAAKETNPYGFLVKPFREKDVLVALNIANYLHEQYLEQNIRRDTGLAAQLEELAAESGGPARVLMSYGRYLQAYVPFDLMLVHFEQKAAERSYLYAFERSGLENYTALTPGEIRRNLAVSPEEFDALQMKAVIQKQTSFTNRKGFKQIHRQGSLQRMIAEQFGLEALLMQHLSLSADESCHVWFYSRNPTAYGAEHLQLLQRLNDKISRVFTSLLDDVYAGPAHGNTYDISSTVKFFEHIKGHNYRLLQIFDKIAALNPTSVAPVLVTGESGTGKEMIVNAVQQISDRRQKPFIKVNCAAIPSEFYEYELFGYEAGAFPEALSAKPGKFEQANGGTIFLDEIGEIPFAFQSKFLRVLQYKEIERVGGQETIKLDFRVIAATNRDLEKEVAAGRFRIDLYYRLNVVLLALPPLRERIEDVPELAAYFLSRFNLLYQKHITGIHNSVMEQFLNYHWPGNIRELENMIERAVLTTTGSEIAELEMPDSFYANRNIADIQQAERASVLAALERAGGKIYGSGGAAELLDMSVSALHLKIKKLGLDRKRQFK